MEATITKQHLQQLKNDFSGMEMMDIEQLLNLIKKLNSTIMEDCTNLSYMMLEDRDLQSSNKPRKLTDSEIISTFKRQNDENLNSTYQIEFLLRNLTQKLEKMNDLENVFYLLEEQSN